MTLTEKTDLQTILNRLVARGQYLERQLAAALAQVGLSRTQLASLPLLSTGIAPHVLAEAQERCAALPPPPDSVMTDEKIEPDLRARLKGLPENEQIDVGVWARQAYDPGTYVAARLQAMRARQGEEAQS